MAPDVWKDVRRILAIRLDNLGDVVMTGPALRTLRRTLPAAEITFMVTPVGSQIARLLPWVDDIIVHRPVWQDLSGALPLDPDRELALVSRIQQGQYDAAVIFTSFSQSPYPPAYVCYLARIPIRLGQSKEFGGSVLSQWVKPPPDETHQVDRNLHLLESAGFVADGRYLELTVPQEVQAEADARLTQAGVPPHEPFIALTPGASCAARMYDPIRFAMVARLVITRTDFPIVLLGNERELGLGQAILDAARCPKLVSLIGQTSVPELVAILSRTALLIGCHSGPLHIADAFRRPMVILFSGTDLHSQWYPRHAPARLLSRPTHCTPCYRFRCLYHMDCLDITPEEVAAEVLALLEQTLKPVA